MDDRERSSEEIRQDIVKEEENLSQAVEEIAERIKEKLDWRAYVQGSPYVTLGIAASIAGEIHESLDGLRFGTAGPGVIKMTLLGIATKAAAGWIKNATSTAGTSGGAGPRPHTGSDSTVNPNVDT